MSQPRNHTRLEKLLATAVFIIAFTFTCRLSIFTQNSLGLFTFSEPLFMLSALLLGPVPGMIVGGIGFTLSNLLLGYPHYVIASSIVNAFAGFLIGRFNQMEHSHQFIGIASTLMLIFLSTLAGTTIYVGEVYIGYTKDLFMGEEIMKLGGLYAYRLYIPAWFWIIIAALTATISILISLRKPLKHLLASASLLIGCATITTGYFLYETALMPILFNVKVDAATNLIVNLGHSVISSTIAALIYWFMKWFSR
ncbi:MAG: ECF transporter S component [Candidatus Bathyarchaeia archaeon]